jgi:hypothetical protein
MKSPLSGKTWGKTCMDYSNGTKCTKGKIPGKKGKIAPKIDKFGAKRSEKEKVGRIFSRKNTSGISR